MRTFEIYYYDLNEDAKKRYLQFQRVTDAEACRAELEARGYSIHDGVPTITKE